MQPIGNDTKQWTAVSSASPTNDRPGEISRELELALLEMANGEFNRYRQLPISGSAPPNARVRADDGKTGSAPALLNVGRKDAAQAAAPSAAPTRFTGDLVHSD